MKGPMNAHVQKPTMWQECAQLAGGSAVDRAPSLTPRQPGTRPGPSSCRACRGPWEDTGPGAWSSEMR